MPNVAIAFIAALGACIGSFLNVVGLRRVKGESSIGGRSHCPRCATTIAWFDNIPVLSWIALRGRCRRCRQPISIRYPLGEFAGGAAFVAVGASVTTVVALVVGLAVVTAVIAAGQLMIAKSQRHLRSSP